MLYKKKQQNLPSNISDRASNKDLSQTPSGTHGPASIGSKPGGKKLIAKSGNKVESALNKRKSSGTPING